MSTEERTANENVFRIKIETKGGMSNHPEADKFEVIREVVEAVNREDILKIKIVRTDSITAI